MDSYTIKNRVMAHYRLTYGYKLIASEVGPWNSDVLVGKKNKEIIEIEVKTSFADFKNDFKKYKEYGRQKIKVYKHETYFNSKKFYYIPNKFYFAVSENLKDKVLRHLQKINSPYGLIVANQDPLSYGKKGRVKKKFVYAYVVKQAQPIHLNYPKDLAYAIELRMGSELIRERLKIEETNNEKMLIIDKIADIRTKFRLLLQKYKRG